MRFIKVIAIIDEKEEEQILNLKMVRRFTPASKESESPIISVSQNIHPGAESIVWFDNSEVLWVKSTIPEILAAINHAE